MDADIFWEIIGNYNKQTWVIHVVFIALILCSVILASLKKAQWLPKISLGLANLFIGIVFFIIYGSEPIQFFFAAPLFITTGFLFIYEGIHNKSDEFNKFNLIQWVLLFLAVLYPIISIFLGNSFPKMVVYIMPCPLISFSIIIYSVYAHKNKVLLVFLSLWGLTGIKSFFFNALEDIILLICGIYCIWLLIMEFKNKKVIGETDSY